MRISGPGARAAARALAGTLPSPRRAGLRTLHDAVGAVLDTALVIDFPGPRTATGEDLVELHCHGGRAVVDAVECALAAMPGLRRAEPGEFTRRGLINGRIDLAEAEGLADLLAAETERERKAALAGAEGRVSAEIRGWLDSLATIAARVEAELDFSDEDDVAGAGESMTRIGQDIAVVTAAMRAVLEQPPVERLRAGIALVIAGPPNSGKSTLINLLADRDVAIVSPVSGTTRDRLEAPVMRDGLAYVLTDTAGLAVATDDEIERVGIGRAEAAIAAADLLLWLGDDPPPRDAIWVHARADEPGREDAGGKTLAISAFDRRSIDDLWDVVAKQAMSLVPATDALALNRRQRDHALAAAAALDERSSDPLLLAERLRIARRELGAIIGIDVGEQLLDVLFARFCIGK